MKKKYLFLIVLVPLLSRVSLYGVEDTTERVRGLAATAHERLAEYEALIAAIRNPRAVQIVNAQGDTESIRRAAFNLLRRLPHAFSRNEYGDVVMDVTDLVLPGSTQSAECRARQSNVSLSDQIVYYVGGNGVAAGIAVCSALVGVLVGRLSK